MVPWVAVVQPSNAFLLPFAFPNCHTIYHKVTYRKSLSLLALGIEDRGLEPLTSCMPSAPAAPGFRFPRTCSAEAYGITLRRQAHIRPTQKTVGNRGILETHPVEPGIGPGKDDGQRLPLKSAGRVTSQRARQGRGSRNGDLTVIVLAHAFGAGIQPDLTRRVLLALAISQGIVETAVQPRREAWPVRCGFSRKRFLWRRSH